MAALVFVGEDFVHWLTGIHTGFHPDTDTVQFEHLLEKYHPVFEDEPFSSIHGPPMRIELEDSAVPCKHFKMRSIPFHWRQAVHVQLQSTLEKGEVEKVPVGESHTWCHPFIRVEDILIFDNNLATHLNRVSEVLERCLTDGIT